MSWTSEKCSNILQHHCSEALICIVKYFWVWHLPNPHISSALKAPLRNEGDDDRHRWQFAIIHFHQLSHHFHLASLYLYQYKIFYLRLPNRPLYVDTNGKTAEERRRGSKNAFQKLLRSSFLSGYVDAYWPHYYTGAWSSPQLLCISPAVPLLTPHITGQYTYRELYIYPPFIPATYYLETDNASGQPHHPRMN